MGRRSNGTDATSFPSAGSLDEETAEEAEELKSRGSRSNRRTRLTVAGDRDNMVGGSGRVRGWCRRAATV